MYISFYNILIDLFTR